MLKKNSKIFLAGHKGLVGSAILRELKKKGFKKIIYATRSQLDLTNQSKVLNFLKRKKPKYIIIERQKLEGFIQIINIGENLFMKI